MHHEAHDAHEEKCTLDFVVFFVAFVIIAIGAVAAFLPQTLEPVTSAASLAAITGRVQVPMMGDFPFAHLARFPAPVGDGRTPKAGMTKSSEGIGGTHVIPSVL